MTLSEITKEELSSYGISDDVVEFVGLTENGGYLVYPCQYSPMLVNGDVVTHTVNRGRKTYWKINEEMKGGNKSPARFFNPKSGECPDGKQPVLYIPNYDFLQDQVTISGGIVHMFEGDKDTWTALSAGILNSCGIMSATVDINHEFEKNLYNMGVRTLHYYPDIDNSGFQIATKIYQYFSHENSKIVVKIHSLPNDYNSKHIKDINDLWIACDFSHDLFLSILDKTNLWQLPTKKTAEYIRDNDVISPKLYDDIEHALGLAQDEFSDKGWSKNISCPVKHHSEDDVKPGFGWNHKERYGKCFKCSMAYSAKDIATALGINYENYVIKKTQLQPSIRLEDKAITSQKITLRKASTGVILSDTYSNEVSDVETIYDELPDEQLYSTHRDLLDTYDKTLQGAVVPEYSPILNPLTPLHEFGGNSHVWKRPFFGCLLGISGGYKTTIMSHMILKMATAGQNVVVFSPEWGDRNIDRFVSQSGGTSMYRKSLHERYLLEKMYDSQKRTDLVSERFGRELSLEDMTRTQFAIENMRKNVRGNIWFMKTFSPNLTHMLAQLRVIHRRLVAQDKRPEVLFIDYGQMIKPPDNHPSWNINNVANYLKQESWAHGWATLLATQARKTDVENLKSGSGNLGSTSAQFLSDYEFNWWLSIEPSQKMFSKAIYDEVLQRKETYNFKEVKLMISKDSESGTFTPEKAPSIFINTHNQGIYYSLEEAK